MDTDKNKIEEVLTRGVEKVFPNVDFVREKLLKGDKVSVYLGIDPTGKSLHLGHVIPLKKLGQLQNLGHQIILLLGDFTAMIGDPTDKTAVRKKLTREEVLENLKEYKKQASRFIEFEGDNPAQIKYNSEWLAKMNFGDVLELTSLMTVDQMMKRDMFYRRNQEDKPIYIHEFLYPLMQGYDSVVMDVDGEIGGNDQTFNMLTGRNMMKTLKNKEKFVVTTKLLTDPSGVKMGKTEGNMISLDQSPEEIYGKVMSWGDGMIIPAFEIVTDLPMSEVATMRQKLEDGANPKEMKEKLAFEIVKICCGAEAAEKAAEEWEKTFSKGEFPDDAPILEVDRGEKIMDAVVRRGFVESKSEFRRLAENGAVSEYPDKKITDSNQIAEKDMKLKIGKKIFIQIKIAPR